MSHSKSADLLPLPYLPCRVDVNRCSHRSRWVRRFARSKCFSTVWLNAGINTINQLAGSLLAPNQQPNNVQSCALAALEQSYLDAGTPPNDVTPLGAFCELQDSRVPYVANGAGPAPYREGHVALPDACDRILDSVASVPVVPRHILCSGFERLLNTPAKSEQRLNDTLLNKPYVDPAFRSHKVYAKFISSLYNRKLVSYHIGLAPKLGVFFVTKKDGSLRLIFDTRIANCYFQDPPSTYLPTATALGSIEAKEQHDTYMAGGGHF